MDQKLPVLEQKRLIDVAIDAPLRLTIAAQIAFPDGSMSAAGLRKERDAGRLVTELIAGKEYVTLAEIAAMREKCRGLRKSSGPRKPGKRSDSTAARPSGSSEADNPSPALAAALATVNALRNHSQSTKLKSTGPTRKS